MSILIKGIDPPRLCDDCPFAIVEWDEFGGSNSYALCTATKEWIGRGTDIDVARALLNKLPNCPIEPLPPNLIDVDKFKADYHMGDDCPTCSQNTKSCEYDHVYSKMDFCSWLDDAERIGEENE